MDRLKLKLLSIGSVLCVFALNMAAILAPGCRASWYQPKEPENLNSLLKNKRKRMRIRSREVK